MFSDIFVQIAVFLFNSVPVIATIIIALTILNGIRLMLVAKRKRAVQARRAAAAKTLRPAFNTFETL